VKLGGATVAGIWPSEIKGRDSVIKVSRWKVEEEGIGNRDVTMGNVY